MKPTETFEAVIKDTQEILDRLDVPYAPGIRRILINQQVIMEHLLLALGIECVQCRNKTKAALYCEDCATNSKQTELSDPRSFETKLSKG